MSTDAAVVDLSTTTLNASVGSATTQTGPSSPAKAVGVKHGITVAPAEPGLPPALVSGFQLLFAGITVALISGALADRMKFGAWMLFVGLWTTFDYFPVAYWVFAFDSEDGSVIGG
jgi:ammonia channel protein AmtB